MERCPNCRSRNTSNNTCERCGCELVILSAVKGQAYKMAQLAIKHKLSDRNKEAEDCFNLALHSYNSEFIRQLKNFILIKELDDLSATEETNDCNPLDTVEFI